MSSLCAGCPKNKRLGFLRPQYSATCLLLQHLRNLSSCFALTLALYFLNKWYQCKGLQNNLLDFFCVLLGPFLFWTDMLVIALGSLAAVKATTYIQTLSISSRRISFIFLLPLLFSVPVLLPLCLLLFHVSFLTQCLSFPPPRSLLLSPIFSCFLWSAKQWEGYTPC